MPMQKAETPNLQPETYEARKKAFNQARGSKRSQYIPVTRQSHHWAVYPGTNQAGNNRKQTNERGACPRLFIVQRIPNQAIVSGTFTNPETNRKEVIKYKVKTLSTRKVLHTRQLV